MQKLRVLDLFSGIGGFSLGLERTGGFETVAFCEIDPFCRRVLAKHWPNVRQYDDVRTLTAEQLAADGIAVDVICGGFPCQDISISGRKAGLAGDRSGLWSEIVRLARDIRPEFILVENVANLLSGPDERPGAWFGRVLGDLASIGFDAEWENIPASALGAPHRRERVWIVAYPCEAGQQRPERQREGIRLATVAASTILRDRNVYARSWALEPGEIGGMADGLPREVGAVGAVGNAVVPQIPELIGNAILASMPLHTKEMR
jgi:DNA (cytosine-5)-methyltransferase 1